MLPLFPEGGRAKKKNGGSVAEWSKALDLGSSLSGGVGSNPTAASSGFNQGREALRVLEKSLKIFWEHFSLAVLAFNMPRTFPQPIACTFPQPIACLLRQGDSVLLLGPRPSSVVYWLLVLLLMIWVNPVLICSSKLIVDLLWQQHALTRLGLGLAYASRIRLQLF